MKICFAYEKILRLKVCFETRTGLCRKFLETNATYIHTTTFHFEVFLQEKFVDFLNSQFSGRLQFNLFNSLLLLIDFSLKKDSKWSLKIIALK